MIIIIKDLSFEMDELKDLLNIFNKYVDNGDEYEDTIFLKNYQTNLYIKLNNIHPNPCKIIFSRVK